MSLFLSDDLSIANSCEPGRLQLELPLPTGQGEELATMICLRGLHSNYPQQTGPLSRQGDLRPYGVPVDLYASIRIGCGRPFEGWALSNYWLVVRIIGLTGHLLLRWDKDNAEDDWKITSIEVWPLGGSERYALLPPAPLSTLLGEICPQAPIVVNPLHSVNEYEPLLVNV